MLEFAFDAAGEAGHAAWEFGDERDDHVGLVDEFEIARVDLAVDVACDVEDLFDGDADVFELVIGAKALSVDEIFGAFGGGDGVVEEDFFVDVAWVEGDEVFGEVGAELVDLGEDVGHVDDVGHGEGGVNFAEVGLGDEAGGGIGGGGVAAA